MKKVITIALSILILTMTSSLASFAFSAGSDGVKRAGAARKSVTVVVIRADWCGACQKLEPTMKELMTEYGGRINFVVLDVTNDETTAIASAKAKSLGLGSFFEANKKMTSTVGVFKGSRNVFKTFKNTNRETYVEAFDNALK